MPDASDLERIRAATLCLVNQERARHNLVLLQPNAQLQQAAQNHSQDMVDHDYFAHDGPGGDTPASRMSDSGYFVSNPLGAYVLGENLAWGTQVLATPAAIVAAWINSPEHEANITNAPFRDSGIGVVAAAPPSYANGQPGATYTQDFGVISATPPAGV